MWWLFFIAAIIVLGYLWLILPYKHWIKKGVKQGSPVPILGDNWRSLLGKQTIPQGIQNSYNACPEGRYYGTYAFRCPCLLIRDPDLIKQITVKDFDHFIDRNKFLPEDVDPLWGKNLFALTGQRWRDMRSSLSPVFTSSKMRYMFSLISQNGEELVKYLLKQENEVIELEMKDTFTRFTTDVIANVVFGVECNSLEDRDNEFYLMGNDVMNFADFWKGIKMLIFMLFPKSAKYTGVRLFSSKVSNFFTDLVKDNIASREKRGIVRPDVINLLMEAKKNGLKHEKDQPVLDAGFATVEESEIGKDQKPQKTLITDEDITAQALLFFIAGFESASSLKVFMAYELAVNQDVQQKLQEEVDSCKGNLCYETLLSMKYLDMVISETLRKWPITISVDRVCVKPYTIEPKFPGEVSLHLNKGDVVFLPIYGFHRDPKYYPDPERFDPERFNDENKLSINPYTYLPFGSGPRNCIGSRFALLEVKALFFHILSRFQIIPINKSQIPIQLSKTSFALNPENGLWLGFKRRTN